MVPLCSLRSIQDAVVIGRKINKSPPPWNSANEGDQAFDYEDPSPSTGGLLAIVGIIVPKRVSRGKGYVFQAISQNTTEGTCQCCPTKKDTDPKRLVTPSIPGTLDYKKGMKGLLWDAPARLSGRRH